MNQFAQLGLALTRRCSEPCRYSGGTGLDRRSELVLAFGKIAALEAGHADGCHRSRSPIEDASPDASDALAILLIVDRVASRLDVSEVSQDLGGLGDGDRTVPCASGIVTRRTGGTETGDTLAGGGGSGRGRSPP